MRYRALDANDDYSFGGGTKEFLVDSPEAVGQAVKTRLALMKGEWFLDLDEGTPYFTEILGTGTQQLYDQAIRERILDTPNVTSIESYQSSVANRKLTVSVLINTAFGGFGGVISLVQNFGNRLDIDFVLDKSSLA